MVTCMSTPDNTPHIDSAQVHTGVESAGDQQTLKATARLLEDKGWKVLSVEPGRIQVRRPFKWGGHIVGAIFTAGLWLFYAVPASVRSKAPLSITADPVGRAQLHDAQGRLVRL